MNIPEFNLAKTVNDLRGKYLVGKIQLLIIGSFIFAYSWIYRVAIRAIMDGRSFKWFNETHVLSWGKEEKAFLYGAGTDGHFVIILLLALFFLALLWLIVRRPDTFTKTVFICWVSIFLVWQLILSYGMGTDYVVHGDSFGISLPYYILGPLEQIFIYVLAVLWFFRNKNNSSKYSDLAPVNHRIILWIMASFSITFLLLRFGEQDGATDKAGIILMYLQLIALVIYVLPKQRENDNEIH